MVNVYYQKYLIICYIENEISMFSSYCFCFPTLSIKYIVSDITRASFSGYSVFFTNLLGQSFNLLFMVISYVKILTQDVVIILLSSKQQQQQQ